MKGAWAGVVEMMPDGSSGQVVSSLVNGAEKLVSAKHLGKGVTWSDLCVRKITPTARVR